MAIPPFFSFIYTPFYYGKKKKKTQRRLIPLFKGKMAFSK